MLFLEKKNSNSVGVSQPGLFYHAMRFCHSTKPGKNITKHINLKNCFVLLVQRSFGQEMYSIFVFEGDEVIWSGLIAPENSEYAILALYELLKPVVLRLFFLEKIGALDTKKLLRQDHNTTLWNYWHFHVWKDENLPSEVIFRKTSVQNRLKRYQALPFDRSVVFNSLRSVLIDINSGLKSSYPKTDFRFVSVRWSKFLALNGFIFHYPTNSFNNQ